MGKVETISEQVRKALLEAGEMGVSRYRLAELIGFTQSAMTRFANGEGGIELATLDKIGSLLGLKVTMSRAAVRRLANDAPKAGRPSVKKAK